MSRQCIHSAVRNSGTTSFTYDYESRVTSITKPGMTTNSMTYNDLDTRVGMTDSTGSRTFKRAGIGVTSPVLSDGSASFTPSGEWRGGVKTAYHGGLKSFDTQTNSAQSIVGQRLTDAFGNEISSLGVWKGRFAYGGPYGYQEDPDTGLRLLGHRYYDSSTGRFLTRNPVKDGRNWYVYCDSNPVSYIDADGLAKIWVMWRPVDGTSFYHALIVIKDETTGKIYVIEGGPGLMGDLGSDTLTLHGGGRHITDGAEYKEIMGYLSAGDGILLLDDDNSLDYWIFWFEFVSPRNGSVEYWLPGGDGGNSNSYAREILERFGLSTSQPNGRLLGWGLDPWGDPRKKKRAPLPPRTQSSGLHSPLSMNQLMGHEY